MDEKEALFLAKENLLASMSAVRRDLKIYNKAVLDRNKAVLRDVGNDVIDLFHRFSDRANISRLERRREKLAKEQVKIEEQIRESVARVQKREEEEKLKAEEKERERQLKEEKKNQRNERFLNFRNGVKQKISSAKSRFGKIKNSILKNLSWNMINARLRSAFDSVQLFGIKAADGIIRSANTVKDSVSDFTSQQIANYYLHKMKKDEIREEKRREKDIKQAEMTEAINEMNRIEERTLDHKIGMIKALDERDYLKGVQNDVALSVQEIMEENSQKKDASAGDKLNLNPNEKNTAKTSESRLGRVKNSVLFNLKFTNIDAKLRKAFDNVQLFGMNMANTAMKGINRIKDGVTNFTSEQIARYSEWRLKREEERAHNARLKEADKMSEAMISERTRDHKIGMKEALDARDREPYDIKHEEFLQKRQELIQSLVAEKNKLIGKQVKVEDYIDEESKHKSR